MGLAQLGRLSGLSMLNLSHCSSLMDECLAALAAAVPQLATLNLQVLFRVQKRAHRQCGQGLSGSAVKGRG